MKSRKMILTGIAAVTVTATAAIGVPLASASSGTNGTSQSFDGTSVNVRTAPDSSSDVVGSLADDESRAINCWTHGETTSNPRGEESDIWFQIDEGFVSGAFFFQDDAEVTVPECEEGGEQNEGSDDSGAVAEDEYSEITYAGTTEDVKQWIGEARAILIENGTDPSLIRANDLAIIAMNESGGDPSAVNDWDSNAEQGTPSIGLMQTIQPTFDAHALPGYTDIHDPVHNIIAASRYAVDKYGSTAATPGPESVNAGGEYLPY